MARFFRKRILALARTSRCFGTQIAPSTFSKMMCTLAAWGHGRGAIQNACYLVFCSPAVSSCCSSVFCQLELGLYSCMALARTSVFLLRSF